MYDSKTPSVFVDEFIQPEKVTQNSYAKHRNAQKIWTKGEDKLLMTLFNEGKSVKEISVKMGRSQTAIIMRLGKLNS
jgi:DNA helicase-4